MDSMVGRGEAWSARVRPGKVGVRSGERDNADKVIQVTMDEIRKVERDWLLASEVAPVMGVDPQSIRVAAKAAPEKLGFPVSIIGSRLRIPKKPFIEFMEGKA